MAKLAKHRMKLARRGGFSFHCTESLEKKAQNPPENQAQRSEVCSLLWLFRAYKHKHFGPVGLGTTPALCQGQAQFVIGTNTGFPLFCTVEAQFVRGTSPVCPWDKLYMGSSIDVLKVHVPLLAILGAFWHEPVGVHPLGRWEWGVPNLVGSSPKSADRKRRGHIKKSQKIAKSVKTNFDICIFNFLAQGKLRQNLSKSVKNNLRFFSTIFA